MSTWQLAILIKPLCLLVLFLLIRLLTRAIERRMNDGKLKQLLFRRIN